MKKKITSLLILFFLVNAAIGQEIKTYSPGDIKIDPSKVISSRAELVDNSGGLGSTSINHGMFKGKSAFIIQSWFLQKNNYLDVIIVDANTFEVLHRYAPLQGSSSEEVIVHDIADNVQKIASTKGGNYEVKEFSAGTSYFNIAAIPHLLALMKLKEGMKFNLKTFNPYNMRESTVYFEVEGKKKVQDDSGKNFDVWVVNNIFKSREGQPFPPNTILGKTTYLVGEEAPYYFGMEMSRIKSREDLKLQKGYTQKVKNHSVFEGAATNKDVSKLMEN